MLNFKIVMNDEYWEIGESGAKKKLGFSCKKIFGSG